MNVDQALARLLERAGSDLLISSGSRPRIRKDGRLEPLEGDGEVLTPTDTERMIRDVLDADQLKELETRRHVDFSFTWRERARIRGNAYYQRNSMAAAFRLLPLEIPSFDMLGIPESVHRLLEKQHGLLLVTGPFASGKSTTNDAPQAIDRIIDSYLGAQQQQVRIQLAMCLAGVIYQQLLPAVGGGRVAAFEVLIANTVVRAMIKEGRTDQIRSVLQTSLREGSQTLERALNQLLRAGLITERDARNHSLNPNDIRA